MFRKRLLWQLFPSYIVVILISLAVVTLYSSHSLENYYFDKVADAHKTLISLYEQEFKSAFLSENTDHAFNTAKIFDDKTNIRLTLLGTNGTVLLDTRENPIKMENHSNRPEFVKAIHGRTGSSVRYSRTLNKDMLYIAVPLFDHDKVIGIIRTSVPVTWLDQNLKDLYQKIILGGLLAAFFAGIVSFSFAKRIKKPLVALEKGVMRFANGDLSRKIPIPSIIELGELTESMNIMAAQLDDRINTIIQQNKEQEAILSNMTEGIIVVDRKYKIIKINKQAKDLLALNSCELQDRILTKYLKNNEFLSYLNDIFNSTPPLQRDLVVNNGQNYLQLNGTTIQDNKAGLIAIIVLNDMTRLQKLENIRKDFVANVSHELKTPITTIKGFIETLQDGSVYDVEEAQHFLSIISKHTSRLNSIIEDLLSLSRLEQTNGAILKTEVVSLAHIISSVINVCEIAAKAKAIDIVTEIEDDILVNIDVSLFEQALINLVDNAIKYSNEGTKVRVITKSNSKEVTIEIQDQGPGIPEEHLPRLFERFYRVDKARSRKAGGTGLGLAIVKHIVQSFNGHIDVKSKIGKGTSFILHLPSETKHIG